MDLSQSASDKKGMQLQAQVLLVKNQFKSFSRAWYGFFWKPLWLCCSVGLILHWGDLLGREDPKVPTRRDENVQLGDGCVPDPWVLLGSGSSFSLHSRDWNSLNCSFLPSLTALSWNLLC